jgi:isoquinoline 1-oxidoreductase beta subunit
MIARSDFLRVTAALGAGLALELGLPLPAGARLDTVFPLGTFVRVGDDGTVTMLLAKSEMGQGVFTGLAMLVAEELDVPMERMHVEAALADPKYGNMSTGGSTSTSSSWEPLRVAGATARAMLVAAAAKRWNVAPSSCTTVNGIVRCGALQAAYGGLAAEAAALPVPAQVTLKDPSAFRIIGTSPPRLDVPAKVQGKAVYGSDVRVAGMHFARIARPPTFGGRVSAVDDRAARAVLGVVDVVRVPAGVAVVATNSWAAMRGCDALDVTFADGVVASSDALFADAERLARGATTVALERGGGAASGKVFEAIYRAPFVAHTTMEPMNATAVVRDGTVDVWAPTQNALACRAAAARVAGVAPERVVVHTTFLGGGFGRRLQVDYVEDAVAVAKASGKPVQVLSSREDDFRHDFYRPMSVNVLRATLDGRRITSWEHRVAQASPRLAASYAAPACYALGATRVLVAEHPHGVPTGALRAPGTNWSAFVVETFVDELAQAAGRDPVDFRLDHLTDERVRGVLQRVAERAWGKPLAGTAQGLATCIWGDSTIALVVDCEVRGREVVVRRAVAAIDCGLVVNPELVTLQIESGISYGMGIANTGKITLTRGRVDQTTFADYGMPRIGTAPAVEVLFASTARPPSGVGELAMPVIAPAMANAAFHLTGTRVRTLPFADGLS